MANDNWFTTAIGMIFVMAIMTMAITFHVAHKKEVPPTTVENVAK